MRATYKVLAHTIAGFVAIQAAVDGLRGRRPRHLDRGRQYADRGALEGDNPPDFFGGDRVLACTFVFGIMLIPLLALVLLIISFFAKIPGGVKWAGIVAWPVVLQSLSASSATRLRTPACCTA